MFPKDAQAEPSINSTFFILFIITHTYSVDSKKLKIIGEHWTIEYGIQAKPTRHSSIPYTHVLAGKFMDSHRRRCLHSFYSRRLTHVRVEHRHICVVHTGTISFRSLLLFHN